MERRRLGRTGLEVPCVGLGTYRVFNVSGDADVARCEAVADALLVGGGNLFDSSPMYGAAEDVLAAVLAGRRQDAFIATKVWAKDRARGEAQIEHAFANYETVDLYQVHNLLALHEHLPYLQHLKAGGRVRAVGVTHYLPSAIPDLLELIKEREVDAVQVPYHPRERTIERELLAEAERVGVAVIVMTPLGAGELLRRQPTREELRPLADFGCVTWAQVLLKWALSDNRVTAVIPATSSVAHMRENTAMGTGPWFTGDERLYVRKLADRLYK